MSQNVGAPLDRIDGPKKVLGEAQYASDFQLPRLAHAVIAFSTVAAGTCTIDARNARAMPGVLRVMTSENAPKLPDAGKVEPPATRVLSLLQTNEVRYNGEPVAVVIADTLERARAAAMALDIRYQTQPAALDYERAKASAYAPAKANQDDTDKRWGNYAAGIETATTTVDGVYATPPENHNPMEPHATVAQWQGDRLTVYDSTQGVFGCRKTLAQRFGIPIENVRVISPFVGGGFGCKGSAWSHVVLAAMAARELGRPVKIALDRPQMFAPVGHRPNTEQHIVLGATRDGKLTAIKHDVISTTSVFEDWVEPSASATRMLYACENGDTSHRLVKLNIGTPTFQRAPGEATGTFALEVAMDELAVALEMDPIELRLRNYAEKDPVENKPFSSKHLRECYAKGAERFGWSRRDAKPRSMRDGRWLVGWGMATATYPARRSKAAALAKILPDGSAVVQAGSQDIGTGTYTIMTQVAADALGLPIGRVRAELGDTALPETPVSGGSQTAASLMPAVQSACFSARDQLVALAVADAHSPLQGVAAKRVQVADGWVSSRDDAHRRETFAAIIARNGGGAIEGRATTDPGDAKEKFSLHSFGAVFADVRVDPDLGTIRLARLHGTYDIGRRLNEKTAHSQLIGGLVWGAGLALFEKTLYDVRSGRIVNANLAEYHVPVNADIGEVDVTFVDGDDTNFNPLGARGIGEIGITGIGGAIANAVYHATGRRIREVPITLDKLI
ncbi:MAG TPA: xanthine dehydrogenase family protein molybdopterin-binding subunit [Rhodanobacteraceae bacterium]|jgi:xanthine dehydrogenase YagR molybdenum-binding subunit|nr:xanthine dehydrogenase family protein molybdopterin-binding subunit [Rhodanobacteraceae bacterium]